jgi:hypothetical protein
MFVIVNIQNQNGSKLMRKFESDVLLCCFYSNEKDGECVPGEKTERKANRTSGRKQ